MSKFLSRKLPSGIRSKKNVAVQVRKTSVKEVKVMQSFRHPVVARISSAITIFMFTFVFHLAPFTNAMAQGNSNSNRNSANSGNSASSNGKSAEKRMNENLLQLRDKSKEMNTEIKGRGKKFSRNDLRELQALADTLAEDHSTALDNFNQIEADLIERGFSQEVLNQHQEAVNMYSTSYEVMRQKLQTVFDAGKLKDQREAFQEIADEMLEHRFKKTHQKTDPNNLPWGTPDASKTRAPSEDGDVVGSVWDYQPSMKVAANVITPDMLNQPGGPTADDLAENVDVKHTEAIRAKASELNDDPLEIYNWVRNNIEFIPSYGSIQGAEYTLQHGKGNAFDTSSLLIALLRSANVPARYAYGTVQMPVDEVMNWVGGVEVPEAAQQLLGQGGIPNTGIISGGSISHIRMETVWVEAWVDYLPSRGAKHVTGDNWIPMDASYKQYEFTEGADFGANVPFNSQELVDRISSAATVDENSGFVKDVDQLQIEAALVAYQSQIEEYFNSQNNDTTLAEVLGIQRVISKEYRQLAAGLPYELVERTNSFSLLPSNLRQKFRYTLSTDMFGSEGSRLITFEQSLPSLAGKKHALSFRPATQSDEDIIRRYLPDMDSEEADTSLLPSTLPGYLINLAAEFSQDGEVLFSAPAGVMGTELYETLAFWSPAFGWARAVNHPIAGEYRAIGLDLQGTNAEDVKRAQADIEAIQSVLVQGESSQISAMSKHQLLGDILYSVIYSYLAQTHLQNLIQSQSSNIVSYRLPSFGVFSTSMQTNYFYGVPRSVSFDGMFIDVDRLAVQAVDKNSDQANKINFLKTSGYRSSAMEHQVPEQAFTTSTSFAQGISAVKALSIAVENGQKIWTITQENLQDALSQLRLSSEIENEIRNAVNAGKVATAHEEPISFAGSTNTGYLLIDSDTGAGAYLIAGGGNGGFLDDDSDFADLLGFIGFGLGFLGAVFGAPLLIYLSAIFAVVLAIDLIVNYSSISHRCDGLQGLIALGIVAAALGVFAAPLIVIVLMYAGLLASQGAITAAKSAACRN